jgi:hypothetical protein
MPLTCRSAFVLGHGQGAAAITLAVAVSAAKAAAFCDTAASLAVPCTTATTAPSKMLPSGNGSTPTTALPPWADRAQCQAHVALLACLHQLHEDRPAAAATAQALLEDELALMDAGLQGLSKRCAADYTAAHAFCGVRVCIVA